MTLNPSLDLSLVEIIDAIDPNKSEPTIEAKMIIGIVNTLNSAESKKTGNATKAIRVALTKPTIPIVQTLLKM